MAENSLSLKKFIYIIFKRKYLITTLFLSIVMTVAVGSFLIKPTYEASSKILVIHDVESEKALLFRVNLGYYPDTNEKINSEVEIIKSRPVAERVLNALNLENMPVNLLLARLSVNRLPESNVIVINYQSKDPIMCANIVNQVTQSYIEYRSQLFKDGKAYEFFNQQIQIADKQLTELEKRQAQFQQDQALLSPEQQNQILLNRLAAYEQELTEARTERISREASLNIIEKQLKTDSTTIIPVTETSDSPSQKDFLSRLKNELLNLEIEQNRLLEIYTPKYDEVIKIEDRIKVTKEKIKQEVKLIIKQEQTAINALLTREEVLKSAIDDIYNQIKDRSQKVFRFSEITRGIDDNREVYSMLLKQREEARISLAKMDNVVKIRIVSPGVVPKRPIKPKKILNILLAICLGLGVGLGAAFLLEYYDHSISSGEEVDKYLNLPLLTSIPEKTKKLIKL